MNTGKTRLWLYLLVWMCLMNSCQSAIILSYDNCIYFWGDKIFMLINSDYEETVRSKLRNCEK